MSYHIHNGDYMDLVARPSLAKRGDKFTLNQEVMGFQGPGCRGMKNVPIPPGNYQIISRKHFRGGTQEIQPI